MIPKKDQVVLYFVFVLIIAHVAGVSAQDAATATPSTSRSSGIPGFSMGPKPTNSVILLSSTPSTPTGLSASASPSGITLSWTRPIVVDKTQILRKRPNQGETSFTQIAETGILDTTYIDTSAVTPGQRYIYKIRVVWGDWTSGESAEVTVDVAAGDVATYTSTPSPTITATRMNGTTMVINSDCSLAEAIIAANTDASAPGCPAGNGDDIFHLTGNVTLTGDLPQITANITINGNGHTINGNGFSMFDTRFGDLTINNATLTGGVNSYGSGAVTGQDADVTITNCTIHGNSADHGNGGVGVSRGNLTITGTTMHSNSATGDYGYGGAIGSGGGTLIVQTSNIYSNSAGGSGGAIHINRSTTTIQNSNIYSNSSVDNGGAINMTRATNVTLRDSNVYNNSAGEDGGAVFGSRSTVNFYDTSVYNNSAGGDGGALYGYRTTFNIFGSTFRNNSDQSGIRHFVAQSRWTTFDIDADSTIETPSATPTATTSSSTATATSTPSPTMTNTPTATATATSSPTATATATSSPTATATATTSPTTSPTVTATLRPPGKPRNLTGSANANGITLSWTAPSGQVDGYEILRRRPRKGENQLTILVADTGSSATTYTDSSATEAGVRYVYRVKAMRGEQKSARSNFVRVDQPDVQAQQQVVASSTPTPTNTPTPTSTPIPPSNTPAPTDTEVPPTNTPIPPSNTPPTDTPVRRFHLLTHRRQRIRKCRRPIRRFHLLTHRRQRIRRFHRPTRPCQRIRRRRRPTRLRIPKR